MTGSEFVNSRSSFVTVVAWFFIVLSGITSFIGIGQNLMLASFSDSFNSVQAPEHASTIQAFLNNNVQLVFIAFLVASVSVLILSIGLLKRNEWARKIFVAFLVLGVLYMIASLFLVLFMDFGASVSEPTSESARQVMEDMQTPIRIIRAVSITFSVVTIALLAWIGWKLNSREVRDEFAT